jgi:hypothetical protein
LDTAEFSSGAGVFASAISWNFPSITLPMSYCITLVPTTTSPRYKSAWLGDPPPMPTIKVARMLGKLRFKLVATIAALFVPYCPGKHAMTMLC